MKISKTHSFTLLRLLTSCQSFDKELALKEFKEIKPTSEIIKVTDYECDGTLNECRYVEFKYKETASGNVKDTTFQYWKRNGKWVINGKTPHRSQIVRIKVNQFHLEQMSSPAKFTPTYFHYTLCQVDKLMGLTLVEIRVGS